MAKTLSNFAPSHGQVKGLCRSKRSCVFRWRGSGCATFLFWEDNTMPDYEKLYHLMISAAEDAIEALEVGNVWDAKRLLIQAEREAEEAYIENAVL